jgi:hypothetical protein
MRSGQFRMWSELMQDFQNRVVDEAKALDDKISKLVAFMDNGDGPIFKDLAIRDKELLIKQLQHMRDYYFCLAQRVVAFTS